MPQYIPPTEQESIDQWYADRDAARCDATADENEDRRKAQDAESDDEGYCECIETVHTLQEQESNTCLYCGRRIR